MARGKSPSRSDASPSRDSARTNCARSASRGFTIHAFCAWHSARVVAESWTRNSPTPCPVCSSASAKADKNALAGAPVWRVISIRPDRFGFRERAPPPLLDGWNEKTSSFRLTLTNVPGANPSTITPLKMTKT